MHNKTNEQGNCLIYCRVSTGKQAIEGESIETQEAICQTLADRENLKVLRTFRDHFSGRKEIRPAFEEIFAYIKTSPKKIDTLIFRAIDRFTRNGTIGYEILKDRLSKMGVDIIDTNGIIQPSKNTLEHYGLEYDWSRTRPSEITELVMAHQGKNEVTQILTRMIGAEIALTRQGYKIGRALDGFLNKKIQVDGKKKVIGIPDPERAHFIVKMYELRASGAFTDEEIVEQINAMGYKTRTKNKYSRDMKKVIGTTGANPLNTKLMQEMIQKTAYCGVLNGKWNDKPIKSMYEGLVSIAMFNFANRNKIYIEEGKDGVVTVKYDYNPRHIKRMKDNPSFPHKKVVMCPECHKPLLGSTSKNKRGNSYPFYHCSRKHEYFGVSKNDFESNLVELLGKLKQNQDFINSFKVTVLNKFKEKEKELGQFAVKVSNNVTELEMEKQKSIDTYMATTNETIRAELEIRINHLQETIESVRAKRNDLEVEESDINSFARHAQELMEHPVEMLMNEGNPVILASLFGLVFDELPTYTEIVNRTPKLSLIYKLSEDFKEDKSSLVRDTRIELETSAMSMLHSNHLS